MFERVLTAYEGVALCRGYVELVPQRSDFFCTISLSLFDSLFVSPCRCRIFQEYLAFFLCLQCEFVHYVTYWAKGMAFVYDMLGELGSVVRVFVVIVMLAEPQAERAAVLTDIFLLARGTLKLVYSIFVIFVKFFF